MTKSNSDTPGFMIEITICKGFNHVAVSLYLSIEDI